MCDLFYTRTLLSQYFFRRSKIKLWNSELGNCSKHQRDNLFPIQDEALDVYFSIILEYQTAESSLKTASI